MCHFRSVIDTKLFCLGSINSGIALAMIHVCTEILKRSFDTRLGHFELPIVSESGLLLNLYRWSVTHVL